MSRRNSSLFLCALVILTGCASLPPRDPCGPRLVFDSYTVRDNETGRSRSYTVSRVVNGCPSKVRP
jgi:hypothetical protein